jgi:septal ring factor EnvC (AmiA/AmiB activator)
LKEEVSHAVKSISSLSTLRHKQQALVRRGDSLYAELTAAQTANADLRRSLRALTESAAAAEARAAQAREFADATAQANEELQVQLSLLRSAAEQRALRPDAAPLSSASGLGPLQPSLQELAAHLPVEATFAPYSSFGSRPAPRARDTTPAGDVGSGTTRSLFSQPLFTGPTASPAR